MKYSVVVYFDMCKGKKYSLILWGRAGRSENRALEQEDSCKQVTIVET